jgi:hypothetical protein
VIEGFEIPDPLPPRQAETRVPDGPYALLLTSDDLHPESWPGYATNPPDLVIHVGQLPQEAELNSGPSRAISRARQLRTLSLGLTPSVAKVSRPKSGFVATNG